MQSKTNSYTTLDKIQLIGNLTIRRYELANGLQVAIVVDPSTPIFTFQTWFKTGSADEPAGRQGLAHLFEHMMFRKTTRRDTGEFDRLVNAHGGTGLNAYTSRDQTVYFFTFPNNKLELAADLEADRMSNLVIDEETFETEKGAVLTEKKRGLDDPVRFLWEELYKLTYTRHNYKYPVIGEFDSIKNFSVGEAQAFYHDFYSPNNALIIVVGDVDPATTMNILVKQYAHLPARPIKQREITTEPPQSEDRTVLLAHAKATQSMIGKVWHIPNMLHSDYPALTMVGRLLTSGKTALLNERLLSSSKTTEVFADAYIGRDLGTFEFFTQLAEESGFQEIEDIFSASVDELAAGKITDEQLQIARNNLLRETYHAATTPASLGQKLGDSFINANDLAFQIKALARIEQVTRDDVHRAISTYLHQGKSTTVHLHPQST